MAVLKVKDGPVQMTVTGVRTGVVGKFGAQIAFDAGDDTVFMAEQAGLRQLGRLGLTTQTAVGQTLRFTPVQKDGMTFVNVDRVGGAMPDPLGLDDDGDPVPRARVSGATQTAPSMAGTAQTVVRAAGPSPMTVATAAALYGECVDAAMATLGAKLEQAGVPVSDMAVQAAAATLFIRVSK